MVDKTEDRVVDTRKGGEMSEEGATRASELAHRALQEAVVALQRMRSGRLTPDEVNELETAVARARQLVASARYAQEAARQVQDRAREQRALSVHTKQEAIAAGERSRRGFMTLVTWGRRHVACPACKTAFIVSFRCSTHEPQASTSVRCARPECMAAVNCMVPESAYAFSVRLLKS